MTEKNNKTLTCLGCKGWFAEDNLIIKPYGAFCEECYYGSN